MSDPNKFNLDFRPAAYFHSAGTKEQEADTADAIMGPSVCDVHRPASGPRPSTLYGDHFLPHREETEVEIARVELESWTSDIISVRARLKGGKIFYSIVDEYEDLYDWSCEPETSDQPLTMAELIELMKTTCSTLDHPGIAFGFLEFKFEYGEEAEDLRNFASVSSLYYPELHDWYEEAMEEWCEANREEPQAEPVRRD